MIKKTKTGLYRTEISFFSNGKRKRIQKSFKRKGDAERWLVEQKTLRMQGINKRSTTFIWLFDNFYEIHKEPFIRPNTKAAWNLTRKAFIDYFGKDRTIASISSDDYQKFITSYGNEHAKATVLAHNQHLSEVFKYAVRERYLPISPTDGVRVTGQKKKDVTYLNTKQIKKLVDYIFTTRFRRRINSTKPMGTPYMVLTAILTGARLSELSGLRWQDIDVKNNVISINYQVDLRTGSTNPKKAELVGLKTKNANRKVPVPKLLIDKLKEIKELKDEFVFLTMKGTLIQTSTVGYELKKLLKECKIDAPGFHFHSLRHSHVALLLSKGVDIYAISQRLGHANFQITLDTYAYLTDEKKRKDDEQIVSALTDLIN